MSRQRDFDNFDEFAEDYRATHNKAIALSGTDSDFFSEYKIVELKKFEDASKPYRVLDFGCGDGNSSVYLRKHFPNATIVGIDVSEESIKQAQKKELPNTTFSAFNGDKIPFNTNEFDLVFTSMVFHHIEHHLHAAILIEIERILKQGGRFYNFEHNPNNPLTRKVVNECEFDKDAVLLSPSYHKSIIIKSGLKLNQLNYTIFFPRHKIFKIFHFTEKLLSWLPIGAQYYVRAVKIANSK
ncbi:MAG: SAM-dependent methyltransferase [Flavobacteriales bacterium CG18_big_fil_WC_8_21_14_2_50_32_9]|nr:MAG: SAM-dependent methyltransferase [Flavobacteriales bacterium CG18_big_fil_WC_8_21_14_2_50_32_9]PJC62193.1 MAG: class I SAM-dependent methyltransferase [Flavobacteriales bacterium CG_4_9_14_0_2_um_filter_32_27]